MTLKTKLESVFGDDERAVSPVIGVILMVAVTKYRMYDRKGVVVTLTPRPGRVNGRNLSFSVSKAANGWKPRLTASLA